MFFGPLWGPFFMVLGPHSEKHNLFFSFLFFSVLQPGAERTSIDLDFAAINFGSFFVF